MDNHFDGMAFVGLVLILFMGFHILKDRESSVAAAMELNPVSGAPTPTPFQPLRAEATLPAGEPEPSAVTPTPDILFGSDPTDFAAPYDSYTITQGPHGDSYGQMAVDIAAGKGATIKSPINGSVTELYVDVYGNPTLVIENEVYRVMLLHGDYTVYPGQRLLLGQPIGTEANHGYTLDMQGNLCAGRDCGYHTHLNVYDKRISENVNPLLLINP